MTANPVLIVIRHATRNTDEPEQDNGLNRLGRKEAHQLLKFYKKKFKKKSSVRVISSPKVRCVETIESIAQYHKTTLEIESRLVETLKFEDSGHVKTRLVAFLNELETLEEDVIVLCSHGDVIPLLTELLCGAEIHLKKAGWIEFEKFQGAWQLKWLLQTVS